MNLQEKKKLVVLTGPTAVGKTELSIELAKRINGEIISCDSIQVYKGFDIGSAKITPEEMNGVPHHLIDILEPTEPFSIADFKEYALRAMDDIYSRGHIPILTGGTGFYIQSVVNDISFEETEDDGYRQKLEILLQEKGIDYLYEMLKEVDPVSCESIHKNNTKRVIRALEFNHQTGKKISEHNETERAKTSPYNFAYFVLDCDRDALYKRIEKRIDIMVEQGVVDEVKNLIDTYHLTSDHTSMQGIGYKEFIPYLKGEQSLEETLEILKRDTRHFAKRQLTWFRREREVIWVNKDKLIDTNHQLDFIINILKEKRIL